jgi:glycosyl hydrolase family 36
LRRPASPYQSAQLPLHGLEPQASYRITDLDSRAQRTYTGEQLLGTGLEVSLPGRPASALFLYERK